MPIVFDDLITPTPYSAEDQLALFNPPEYGDENMWSAELNGAYRHEDAPYYAARAAYEDQQLFASWGALPSEAVLPSNPKAKSRGAR